MAKRGGAWIHRTHSHTHPRTMSCGCLPDDAGDFLHDNGPAVERGRVYTRARPCTPRCAAAIRERGLARPAALLLFTSGALHASLSMLPMTCVRMPPSINGRIWLGDRWVVCRSRARISAVAVADDVCARARCVSGAECLLLLMCAHRVSHVQ